MASVSCGRHIEEHRDERHDDEETRVSHRPFDFETYIGEHSVVLM
jgi:hypothetical protein